MNKLLPIFVAGLLAAAASTAQNSGSASTSARASANAGGSSLGVSSGTMIDATLAGSLDAKKNKPGDRVVARTAQDVKQDGKVVLKKGTTLVGHVTQAQVRAGEQTQSLLGIVFDRAEVNGHEAPLAATIQALAAAQSSAVAGAGSIDPGNPTDPAGATYGAAPGRVLLGEVGPEASGVAARAGSIKGGVIESAANAAGTANSAIHSAGAVGGLTAAGRLSSNSSGVFGLEGLSLNSASSNAAQGALIVSPGKNVHLDGGTQLLLKVTGQAQ